MTEPLTPLERRVYHYLIDFLAENTYQPSIREIAKKFRIKSTKTVSDLLASLSQKGFIQRDQSRSRGVRIVGFSRPAARSPFRTTGRLHAGEPALLPEHREGFITMDRRFLPSDDVFFLRIKGDSHDRPRHLRRRLRDGLAVDAREGRRHRRGAARRGSDGEDAARIGVRRSCSSRRTRTSASS